MSTNAFLPMTFAQLWVDSSTQLVRATAEFWSGVLGTTPARKLTSTASPWWMPPQSLQATADPALWPASMAANWMPNWPHPLSGRTSAGAANPFLPWLPTQPATSASNPFVLLQQMWLEAAAPMAQRTWTGNSSPAVPPLWQPFAAAYRTANGHATAAVLRTMADVVEPKPQGFAPAHYWPTTLGTQH